jgi:hypothetical protein
VVAAAVAVGILFAVVVEYRSPTVRAIAAVVMVAQLLVGLAGFAFHLRGNLLSPMERITDKFVFGSPIFAPLLFANIAILGLMGLWALGRAVAREAEPDMG